MVILVDLLKQQTGYLVRLFFEKLVRSCLYFLFRFPKSSNTYADSNILYFVFIIVGIFSRLTPAVEMVDVNHNEKESNNADNLHSNHPSKTKYNCGGSGRGRFYDIFTRISYYRGWIQRVVEDRYDGGVCSVARLLDSPLRCPAGKLLASSCCCLMYVLFK
jgi:hypothetical protein